jgi:hypothetical protein
VPLYEFYCAHCHAVYTFRAQRVDTMTIPACPDCNTPLKREISLFSALSSQRTSGDVDSDELAVAQEEDLIAQMTNKMEQMDGDDCDPAQAVRMMRQMASCGGKTFSRDVEEAFARIEAGENPDKIGDEFGEIFANTHNPFTDSGGVSVDASASGVELLRLLCAPRRIKEWYDMPEPEDLK